MTTGRFVLITNNKAYISTEFVGNMELIATNYTAYLMFEKVVSRRTFFEFLASFNAMNQTPNAYAEIQDKACVKRLWTSPNLDFSDSECPASKYESDYLYIKNAEPNIFKIKSKTGETYNIYPGEVMVWHNNKLMRPRTRDRGVND